MLSCGDKSYPERSWDPVVAAEKIFILNHMSHFEKQNILSMATHTISYVCVIGCQWLVLNSKIYKYENDDCAWEAHPSQLLLKLIYVADECSMDDGLLF